MEVTIHKKAVRSSGATLERTIKAEQTCEKGIHALSYSTTSENERQTSLPYKHRQSGPAPD